MEFQQAVEILLDPFHEGEYSDDPFDRGGETMYGITRKVAILEGYYGDMHLLPRSKAIEIYKNRYWDVAHCDEVPQLMKYPLFDAAVNSGPTQAIEWLQQALDVGEDGIFGPVTRGALTQCDQLRASLHMQAIRLDDITSYPTWGHHGRGWARRIALNMKLTVKESVA